MQDGDDSARVSSSDRSLAEVSEGRQDPPTLRRPLAGWAPEGSGIPEHRIVSAGRSAHLVG